MKKRHKQISKSGSVTIPSDIRNNYGGFGAGDAVDIEVKDGKIIISRHLPKCEFCGSANVFVHRKGKHACSDCIGSMAEEIMNQDSTSVAIGGEA